MALKILLQSDSPTVSSGYGQSTKLLVEIFKKLGHEVAVFAYFGIEGVKKVILDGLEMYARGNDNWGNDVIEAHFARSGADVVITNVDPFVLNNYGGRGFPWVPITPVAGDPLSGHLKNSISGALDIISISKFGKQTLQDKGVESTLIYLPIPTGYPLYYPLDRRKARDVFGWPQDAYIIGNVGMNRGTRKGQDILLRAFQLALAEIPNLFLYMHTDVDQGDGLPLRKIAEELDLMRNIRFPARYDVFFGESQYWMNGMYNALDLYVQPSLAEGQGMPLWESYSVAQPVVATDATSLSEVMDDAEAIRVPVRGGSRIWMPFDCWGYPVTPEDLADGIIQANRKWGKKYVSMQNRDRAIANVSVEEIAHHWQTKLVEIEKKVRYTPVGRPWKEHPKIIQISTRVHNCGIGQYTRALMASMFESTEQECLDILDVGAELPHIPEADIVHVHFESGIWPGNDVMKKALWKAKSQGAKVVCTYHAIIPEVISAHLKQGIVDIPVIHWPILNLKIDDPRVWVLGGMGCPMFNQPHGSQKESIRERYGFTMWDKIITTFGFASVGRGHFEVLEKLAPMMLSDPHIKMQLIVPGNFLNEAGKNIVHQKIQEIAAEFHIGKQVVLVPDFISDLEALNRLWASDIGFLYIGGDTLSSSSAASFFVSARLPLVVTPSSHFSHLRRGIVRTEDFSLPTFSHAVWDAVHNQPLLTKLREEHEANYRQFNYKKFGENYLAVYKKAVAAEPIYS